jgi:hypothetical protein
MKKEYETEIYYSRKSFVYLFSIIMVLFIALYFWGIMFNTPLFPILGFIFLCFLPFFFQKRIKNFFTKRAFLEFDDFRISIKVYQHNNDFNTNKLIFNWHEIKSYKIYFSPSKITILTFYFKNGSSKTFGFKDNKTFDEAMEGESVFYIFYSFVNRYNLNKDTNKKINLTRSFLSSKHGTIALAFEAVFIISAFFLHIIKQPNSSFLTLLLGFSIVIQQIVKRKSENKLYNKITSQLN